MKPLLLALTLVTVLVGVPSFSSAGVQVPPAVQTYDAFKLNYYEQTGPAAPTVTVQSEFSARIFLTAPLGTATSQLTTPGPNTYSMGTGGSILKTGQTFTSQAAMEVAYPGGTYSYALSSVELSPTSQAGALTFPVTPYYALSVPTFSNFAAMVSLNANQSFTFQWNSFVVNPFAQESDIFFRIFDSGNNAIVDVFIADQTTTSREIAPNTLNAGQSYRVALYFSSRENHYEAGFNGANSLVAFDEVTQASIMTVPEPATCTFLGAAGMAALGMSRRRRHSPNA